MTASATKQGHLQGQDGAEMPLREQREHLQTASGRADEGVVNPFEGHGLYTPLSVKIRDNRSEEGMGKGKGKVKKRGKGKRKRKKGGDRVLGILILSKGHFLTTEMFATINSAFPQALAF